MQSETLMNLIMFLISFYAISESHPSVICDGAIEYCWINPDLIEIFWCRTYFDQSSKVLKEKISSQFPRLQYVSSS